MLKLLNNTVNRLNSAAAVSRTSSPSFGRIEQEPIQDKFVSSAQMFLNLGDKDICDSVQNSVKKENFLGNGGDAEVYLINDTNLAVKIPHDCKKSLKRNFERIAKIDECDKINHVVAKFENGVQIMNLIEGYPLLQPGKEPELPRKETNQMLVNLPVSAFHGLFKQVCSASDKNMIFDCSPQNVILNPKAKTLTAIDFNKMDPDYPEVVKPLRHIFEALTTDAPEIKQKCAGLLILAALEELKPETKPCLPVSEFKFNDFFKKLKQEDCAFEPCVTSTLKEKLMNIQILKLNELNGDNVKDSLITEIQEVQEIIKEKVL